MKILIVIKHSAKQIFLVRLYIKELAKEIKMRIHTSPECVNCAECGGRHKVIIEKYEDGNSLSDSGYYPCYAWQKDNILKPGYDNIKVVTRHYSL